MRTTEMPRNGRARNVQLATASPIMMNARTDGTLWAMGLIELDCNERAGETNRVACGRAASELQHFRNRNWRNRTSDRRNPVYGIKIRRSFFSCVWTFAIVRSGDCAKRQKSNSIRVTACQRRSHAFALTNILWSNRVSLARVPPDLDTQWTRKIECIRKIRMSSARSPSRLCHHTHSCFCNFRKCD